MRTHGIRCRYGAVGRKGSIAIIERFWRSLKAEHGRGLNLFRPLASIRAGLRAYVAWFTEIGNDVFAILADTSSVRFVALGPTKSLQAMVDAVPFTVFQRDVTGPLEALRKAVLGPLRLDERPTVAGEEDAWVEQ